MGIINFFKIRVSLIILLANILLCKNIVYAQTVQNISDTLNKSEELGVMNKELMATISIIILVLPFILVFMWIYNNLVSKEEEVLSSYSQIESNIQRKADLVPELVETVRTYMQHEQKVILGVVETRVDNEEINNIIDDLENSQAETKELAEDSKNKLNDEKYMAELAEKQKHMGQQMSHLFAVAENYPDLKASDNFLSLQAQLEGTENRINVARMSFNEQVKDYNAAIRKMPNVLIAGLFNFKRKAYFEIKDDNEPKKLKF